MASNNPHLGKKRSSRRSFGRSILRRSGAELAESASRRSSSAKRLVDSGGNSVRMRDESSRRSSSAKRLVDTAGSSVRMRDGSSRRRSSALRKSRSSEGPPRDAQRTPSPPEGARQAGMDLEQSDSDSLDAAPLLCKSASAQNLAGHWRRAPGRAPPLQKSHSVVAGAREVALLAARREQWHGSRHLSAPAPRVPRDTATPQSPGDKGAQEDVAPLGDAKGHKHVTYGPVKSVSVDSAHPPKRVRVTVKKIPPPPPVRYQSLQRSGTLGEGSEPPPGTPARMGEAEGTAGDKAEGTAGDKAEGTAGDEAESASPPAGKGRMVTPSASSAHVCPWELVQEEILSRKQKAAEAAEGGSAGDTAATSPGPKSPPKKSFRSLGLAIKALNRSRGKGILKGKSEGSLRKRGSSRRDKSGLAETSAVSLGGLSPAPAAKSPERSGQSLPLQHNNNAAIPGEAADWGDSGAGGQWDSLALGTALGDKVTEEPSAARGDAGAAEAPEPPSEGHQGAAGPAEVAEPQEGDEDVAGVTAEEGTLEQLEGTSRSFQEEERPPAKPTPSSVRGEVGPHGIAAARGALLRQEAIAAREDGGIPESPDKALEKGRSQPEPERGPGRSWSGAGSEISAAGTRGDSSSKAGIYPGKGGSEGDSQRSAGMEKPPEVPRVAPQQAEGRRAEVCPWESREQGRSVRAEICPWDTEQDGQGAPKSERGEQPGMGLAGKPPALPKPSSQRAGTTESRKNICPWEVEGEPQPKIEICPWEGAAAPSGKERVRQDTWGTSKGEEKVGSRAPEKGKEPPAKSLPKSPAGKAQSSERAEICPWEAQDSKSSDKAEICPWEAQDSKPSDKAEICPWEAQDSKSSDKAEICPWEAQDSKSSDKAEICPWEAQKSKSSDKAEICPWEVAEPQLEKGTAPGKERMPGKEEIKALEKGSRERESICPWESPDMEQPLDKPKTESSELPKSPSGKSKSSESLKAEICPWESQDLKSSDKAEICPWESQDYKSSDKAEICPWEVAAPQMEKGREPGKGKFPGKEETKALEKGSRERESICPWESPDTEQPLAKAQTGSSELPKESSRKSQSMESLKAEICPWEAESNDKAEICPWEVAEPQMERGTGPGKGKQPGKEETKALEKRSRERESICSWESPDTEQPQAQSRTGSSELPKSPSEKSQSSESLRAEICPWESQDLESIDRAEICPWETQDLKPKDKAEIVSWESQDSKSSDRAEMCLWDVVAHQLEKSATPDLKRPPHKQGSKALQRGSRERESISPWDSPDPEKRPGRAHTGSSELPKSPSAKSQSSESLRAEICPWEGAEAPSQQPKAKQVPAGGSKGDKRITRQAALASPDRSLDSRDRESIGAGDSPDTEQPLGRAHTGSSELPKSPSGKSQSSESLRAEICPWESQDIESIDRAEIGTWEVAELQMEKGTAAGKGKQPGKEETKALEKRSRERESICSWESPDTEQPLEKTRTGSSELPKSPSEKSQSSESLRAEICPWESQDLESIDRAEIGTWETQDLKPKDKAETVPWESQDSKSSDRAEMCIWDVVAHQLEKSATPDLKRPPHKQGSKALQRGSRERESISPWDSPDPEKRPGRAHTGSSELPKSPSAKSQSMESLRAEICPWEGAEAPSQQPKAQQVPAGGSKGDKRITRQAALASPDRSLDSRDRESSGAGDSPDTEQPLGRAHTGSSELPKSPSGKSQSSESLRAEICPWESQDLESIDRAEIGTWEVAELQMDKGTGAGNGKQPGKEETKAVGKGSRERESICSWESPDMEQPLDKSQTGSSELPKSPSGKSQSSESLRAEICPWESQDLESIDRAEICPWESQDLESIDRAEIGTWEVAELQLEKGTAAGKGKQPGKEETKAVGKGSRERESICSWDSPDTEQPLGKSQIGSSELPKSPSGKSQSSESLRAEICPWESQDLESIDRAEIGTWETQDLKPKDKAEIVSRESQDSNSSGRAEMCIWDVVAHQLEKSATPDLKRPPHKGSKALQRGSRERESISPWDSPDPEKRPGRAHTGSSELPKSPSAKSQSMESLRAEICPWESQDLESIDRAEICPWEGAAPQMETGTATPKERLPGKEASRALEKTSRERESICPWETPDTEQPLDKTKTGSSELPKSPSGKSQSSEKAEICPWEVESSDKSEICPWEGAEPQLVKGKEKLPAREASKTLEKRSRDQESIHPWESLATEEPSLKTTEGKEPSKKSDSTDSRKSEICPWEAAEPLGSEGEISQPGVQPQGAHRASPAVSPTFVEKSRGRSHGETGHKPLCRLQPSIQHPGLGSSSSPSTGLAELCPWEAPSAPAKASLDSRRSSEVCPGQEESTEPSRTGPGHGRAGGSPREGGGV
ncbi:probable G-protein coupled receptor 179 isoform X4 [Catharus ustulatus]|nr:probable G-protein coupled receptor 179 isoform X4 [Catharus ustulatus]XP_042635868.1 probable G-protein coupled receptor 179 isoform X4 [Catharus ustulatus]